MNHLLQNGGTMIRIKESYHSSLKPGLISDGIWLEKAMNRVDALGRKGIDLLNAHGMFIVRDENNADIGFSLHGDPVQGVSKSKCILLKGEPPIYNVYFGRKLSDKRYLDEFLGVMSNTITEGLDEVHFNSPQNAFEHMSDFFSRKNRSLLCMILKNKMKTIYLNKLVPGCKKWNQYSNHKLRVEADKGFCSYFGKDYESFGKGWDKRCYQGEVGFDGERIIMINKTGSWERKYINPVPPEYYVISRFKFNFCPENSRFDGYVTEKPIQAMACGTIPVYCGAPDVRNYLPEGTFIDTDEVTPLELCNIIYTMDEKEQQKYRKRIKKFLTTKESDNFSSYIFAKKLIKLVEEKL